MALLLGLLCASLSSLAAPPPLLPNPAIRQIFVLHADKTGGATLSLWAHHVAKEHGLKVHVQQGLAMQHADSAEWTKRNDTIYLTSIRDPIVRAMSAYAYDGRWPLGEMNRTATNGKSAWQWMEASRCHSTTRLKDCSAKAQASITRGVSSSRPMTLDGCNGCNGCGGGGARHLAIDQCSSNCFVKSFSGIRDSVKCSSTAPADATFFPRMDAGSERPPARGALERALKVLDAFDIVMVCDGSNARTPGTTGASSTFGRQAYYEHLMRRLGTSQPIVYVAPDLHYRTTYWNMQLPPRWSATEKRMLSDLNRLDIELYQTTNHAKGCSTFVAPESDAARYKSKNELERLRLDMASKDETIRYLQKRIVQLEAEVASHEFT